MQHALARSLRPQLRVYALQVRALSTPPPSPPPKPTAGSSEPYRHEKPPPPPRSWLTRQLMQSPTAMSVFMKVFGALGYGSSKQVAARRALAIYENLCAVRAEEEQEFWQNECHLPPTFQSWFTVTNLHVWIITTRLRALPSPHGQEHIQGLIDHFFLDVEDRIRQVLQPQPSPSSPSTKGQAQQQAQAYYSAMTSPKGDTTPNRRRGRAPEALVTKQMKIFREQWAGLGMAFDLGLIRGDAEMAGAIWRNLLGARGAQGITYGAAGAPAFRRAINPSGEIEKYGKMDDAARQREELRDDGSGVHDFAPAEVDKYVRYPETMATLVAYIRAETRRLAELSDEQIAGPRGAVGTEGAGIEQLKFGKISDAQRVVADVLGA